MLLQIGLEDLETSGARLGVMEVEAFLRKPEFKFLAEMMNFPGVINGNQDVLEKIKIAKNLLTVITQDYQEIH